jgi:gliding motility-associated-like protein
MNAEGCLATAAVTVIVVNDKPIFIPNSFSPNNDGVNDGFTLFSGPAVNRIEQLQIFDRWGGMVYQSKTDFLPNEPSLGWDGTVNGEPVNGGVFVYQFVVEFQNGELEEYAGDVTVVR